MLVNELVMVLLLVFGILVIVGIIFLACKYNLCKEL